MRYTVGQSLQVYHQERTITKYLYQKDLPAMSEMSLCFWMKLEVDDDNRGDDWLVSVSLPGTGYIYMCMYIQRMSGNLNYILTFWTKNIYYEYTFLIN